MRNFEMNKLLVLTLGVFVTACSERPTEPGALSTPAFAKGGAAACPTPADVVVSDEAGLLAALAAAQPGDVIGLDGFFGITSDVIIATEDVTLTCTTSGSGLFAEERAGVIYMLNAYAEGVMIDRLVLDASEARNAYFAWNDGVDGLAQDVRFSNNTVTCGPGQCIFLAGVAGAVIVDNYFESHGSGTGVHIQGTGPRDTGGRSLRPTDGTRVERNTIIATAPQTGCGWCGGIRPRDGSNLVVSHNTVIGPWLNSISTAMLFDSEIKSNRLEDAQWFGIGVSRGAGSQFSARDNVFRNNKATGAGIAGVHVQYACDNLFLGNILHGNAEDVGLIFEWNSGANTLVGNKNVVVDDGDFDCDGDDNPDPNIITGSGAVLHGVNLGEIISDAVVSSGGIVIQ